MQACETPPLPLGIKAWNLFSGAREREGAFSFDSLLARAMRRSRLSDFGDMAFGEGLRAFLEALREDATFHSFGRFFLREMIVAMLTHRLRLEDFLRRHPEATRERIVRPIVVLGLPRSGTTLLFNLLAQDPALRFMRNWESFIAQTPPAGRYSFATDPRRKQAKRVKRLMRYLMPDLDARHVFEPDGPEECTPILMQGFATQAIVGNWHVPSFAAWLKSADRAPTYRHHKRAVQALQWKYPGTRWVWKSPDHLAGAAALLRACPDACFIHVHRHPIQSVSSWASLNLTYRGVYYRRIDKHALGRQALDQLACDTDRYLADRDANGSGQFHDLHYEELTRNPVRAMEGVYKRLGMRFDEQTKERLKNFLNRNPKNRHGVHSYAPQDFGLTPERVAERFQSYCDRFRLAADPVSSMENSGKESSP